MALYRIIRYTNEKNIEVITQWLDKQRDYKAVARVLARIEYMRDGNFGDCKPLQSGVWELRIDVGQGYRLYYSVVGKELVLLLCGGDKRSQNKDISQAIKYLEEYKRRIKK